MFSFHSLGDEALLINFDQKIDPFINSLVHTLAQRIELAQLNAIRYVTPAYCSLTVAFNKKLIDFDILKEQIEKLGMELSASSITKKRKLYIPVCYHRKFALDMDEVTDQTGLSPAEIVEKHTSLFFQVYMIGFLPGFPYLGKLPLEMKCSRKATPRLQVAKGAVGLAGLQTGIYPSTSPGGWQIIGNTPVNLESTNSKEPFLIQSGDEVQFYSISKSKYFSIEEQQKRGKFDWTNVYE